MKKAIFIDRDGTLIHEVGYLKMLEDLRFTSRAPDALRMFHEMGYLNLIVTNQSAVARGILSPKELKKIHTKIKNMAAEEGGVIDDFFFCPHLPAPAGRVPPYNVECSCRKPAPGMIHDAQVKHRLDLTQCVVVGDKLSDLHLAQNAGIRSVLVLTGYGLETKNEWEEEVETYPNLFDFARRLKDS